MEEKSLKLHLRFRLISIPQPDSEFSYANNKKNCRSLMFKRAMSKC